MLVVYQHGILLRKGPIAKGFMHRYRSKKILCTKESYYKSYWYNSIVKNPYISFTALLLFTSLSSISLVINIIIIIITIIAFFFPKELYFDFYSDPYYLQRSWSLESQPAHKRTHASMSDSQKTKRQKGVAIFINIDISLLQILLLLLLLIL